MEAQPKVPPQAPVYVSMAVFAWNEERAIVPTLRSVLRQSLFAELQRRGQRAEVCCMANGCTDRTVEVASDFLAREAGRHPCAVALDARVSNLPERGKVIAWNQFVHRYSAREARFLFMMDADILISRPETLWNMVRVLETEADAHAAVDRPRKHLCLKPRKSIRDRLSLGASRATLSAEAQLCGQLYCLRAEVARRLYLPRDLAACEDGFIKALVCTDLLAHEPWPGRLRVAPNAEHIFEAYTSPAAILKNQKRQVIGQTIVHLLVDRELQALSAEDREQLGATLQRRDAEDPGWLKRAIRTHLERTRWCWRLHPGLLGLRLRRLRGLPLRQRVGAFPAAVAGTLAAFFASFLAYRALKAGCTDYWPKARRNAGPVLPAFAPVPRLPVNSP